jgi:NADH:ubiquinone oxidoreductase subunit 6 (subunit J)
MDKSLLSGIPSAVIVLILLLLMILSYWSANKISLKVIKKEDSIDFSYLATIEGSILGLLALIIAFTFNMSVTRYEQRRQVVIDESNNIGTALLRCDLYPDSIRTELRKDFKEYIESRIAYFEAKLDEKALNDALTKSNKISGRIWKHASENSKDSEIGIIRSNIMMPALNNMIDIVTTRDALRIARVPDPVLWLMFSLCIISSFFIGFGRLRNIISVIVIWGIVIMTVLSVFIILDLDRSRQGIITNDAPNQKIIELRNSFE